MRRTPDQSLFAWTRWGLPDPRSLLHEPYAADSDGQHRNTELWEYTSNITFLASSLNDFKHSTDIRALSHDEVARRLQLHPNDLPTIDYTFTPYGIRTQFPVIPLPHYFPAERTRNLTDIPLSWWHLVILGCGHKHFPGHLLARIAYLHSEGSSVEFLRPAWANIGRDSDLLPLSPAAIARLRSSGGRTSIRTLYIPQPERDQGTSDPAHRQRHEMINLVLPEKVRESLSTQGYAVTLHPPDARGLHSVALSHNTHTITIEYSHSLEQRDWGGQQLTVDARVKTLGPVLSDALGNLRVPQVDHRDASEALAWGDSIPWRKSFGFREAKLNIPGRPTALTLTLGLTFATTNYYLLHIELDN